MMNRIISESIKILLGGSIIENTRIILRLWFARVMKLKNQVTF